MPVNGAGIAPALGAALGAGVLCAERDATAKRETALGFDQAAERHASILSPRLYSHATRGGPPFRTIMPAVVAGGRNQGGGNQLFERRLGSTAH